MGMRAAPADTDSLYNPHYGYFSKQVVIFSPGEPFDFNALRDEPAFHAELGRRYTEFEDALDARAFDATRQLWHTPTELFRPYYGEAVARYLMSNYIMSTYPYHDLIVYEMGAGRGTLMLNVLDYIRDNEPSIYDRTKYKIIEISPQLASLQQSQLNAAASAVTAVAAQAASRGHADKVEIINRSIFDWRERVPSPCFFLAMEVFDNFAHDALRYDLRTDEPLQGTVMIDGRGDFHEFYEPVLDPLAARYLRVRDAATGGRYPTPYAAGRAARWLRSQFPFAPNLSDPEYIPTRLLQFFDILERYFPAHRLLTSDFHALPDTVRGLNSPLVQTRFERRMVPVTTPLVSSPPRFSSILSDTFRGGNSGSRHKKTVLLTHHERRAGPPGLLRHPVPDGLRGDGGGVPAGDGQADAHHVARGLHALLGLRREHPHPQRREPPAVLVRQRQRPRHRVKFHPPRWRIAGDVRRGYGCPDWKQNRCRRTYPPTTNT